MRRHSLKLLVLLLVLPLLAVGCNVETDRSEKPSPDWSRGLRLGSTNFRQPVALQVDADRQVHLVWCDQGLRYARLDRQARVQHNGRLDVDLPNPRKPQLLVDNENRVHLAWLSRDEGIQRLFHVLVGPEGAAGQPLRLSAEGSDVEGFDMYLSPAGGVAFVWSAVRADGTKALLHATLDAPSTQTVLAENGIDPYVLVDDAGTTHLVWLQGQGYSSLTLYYATLEGTGAGIRLAPAGRQELTEFDYPEGGVYYGPTMGVDTATLYVMWSVQNLGGGLTPTSAFSYYIAFPFGQPAVANPRSVKLPATTRPTYDDYQSPYGLTKLAILPPGGVTGIDFVNTPATVTSQRGELPVTFSLMTESEAESHIQLATGVFAQGRQVGYQLSSKTKSASLMPSMAVDGDGYLYLAWIDTAGFSAFEVYLTSNAPQVREWLDRTSTDDLVLRAADLVFGVMSGIGLLPIAGIWSFPPLVWVVVFFIFSGQEELERTPAKIGFAVAVALYVGLKLLLLPGLFRGTPFLYQVPREWATAVGIAVPLLILAVALGAVYLYRRRAARATIFKGYLIFALVDVVLTLVLYSPGFFRPG